MRQRECDLTEERLEDQSSYQTRLSDPELHTLISSSSSPTIGAKELSCSTDAGMMQESWQQEKCRQRTARG